MLIKKHHVKQPPPAPSQNDPAGQLGVPGPAIAQTATPTPEPIIPVTAENIQQGLAEDRRVNQTAYDDRRRGYRRIEDRHLISKAHEEARRIKEKAFEEGFEKGLMLVNDQLEDLRQQFGELLLTRTKALGALTDDIAPIAVEIAERLIKVELSCDEELVNTIVDDTLQKLDRHSKSVLIKVNPDDKAQVRAHLNEHPPTHLKAEIIVIDEPTVEPGGCVVETDSGLIDASFSTRLTILKEMFGTYQPAPKPMNELIQESAEKVMGKEFIDEVTSWKDNTQPPPAPHNQLPGSSNNITPDETMDTQAISDALQDSGTGFVVENPPVLDGQHLPANTADVAPPLPHDTSPNPFPPVDEGV